MQVEQAEDGGCLDDAVFRKYSVTIGLQLLMDSLVLGLIGNIEAEYGNEYITLLTLRRCNYVKDEPSVFCS